MVLKAPSSDSAVSQCPWRAVSICNSRRSTSHHKKLRTSSEPSRYACKGSPKPQFRLLAFCAHGVLTLRPLLAPGEMQNHPNETLFKADIAARCAINAVLRPKEDLHIATLSEMFVESQLERMRQFMMQEEEGREILKQRPLFDDRFIDYEGLRRLPENTLGYALMKFLDGNSLHAGHRQPVRFVEDEELAYILTRYRQLHDVMHAAFGMGISVESEVALKLIEFHQTGLPMTLLSAAFGPFAAPLLRVQLSAAATDVALAGGGPAAVASVTHSLTEAPNSWLQLLTSQKEKHPAASATPAATPAKTEDEQGPVVLYPRQVLLNDLLPWADAAGKAMRRRVYCLFVEEWLDKPLDAFREHCCIMLPPAHLLPYCA
ncbi:ubiquinone biosynthesis protein coq4 [Cyclospora cayetanensis]|uniref:Ubiquinone biosynthesis protein COQ4 homolog, mitochondrial n=1 Tax=Cyclospora cayetanensis TaxID=88456 RepID=A0A1D3D099_9EIME|nr:ubiquinone biosynthesis protein coq4 [Cyclospora cayetanensis]